jgi:hypothetical protein
MGSWVARGTSTQQLIRVEVTTSTQWVGTRYRGDMAQEQRHGAVWLPPKPAPGFGRRSASHAPAAARTLRVVAQHRDPQSAVARAVWSLAATLLLTMAGVIAAAPEEGSRGFLRWEHHMPAHRANRSACQKPFRPVGGLRSVLGPYGLHGSAGR